MGLFSQQILNRKKHDEKVFSDSFIKIADSVTGTRHNNENVLSASQDAIKDVLKYYGFDSTSETPKEITDFNEQLDYLTHPFGVMYRQIKLTSGWQNDSIGAMLGFLKENGNPVALLPKATKGYHYYDGEKYVTITNKNANILKNEGYCFYKPFPIKKLTPVDLMKYALETRSIKDYVSFFIFMGVTTLIGLLSPKISYFLYNDVIANKSVNLLVATVVLLVMINISNILFNLYKTMYNSIISTKMNLSVNAATMMRILSLPASFFRKYSSGELSSRASYVSSLCSSLVDVIFNTGLTSLFSLVYIASIFKYAPGLVIPSIVIIVVTVAFSVITSLVQIKLSKKSMELATKESGISFAMISGIQKIRLAGAEKRAFARWAELFAKSAKLSYSPPAFIKFNGIISSAISLIGTIAMYYFTIKTKVSMAEYYAFNTAYGMVFGAFSSVASIALTAARIKPVIDMARPLMEEVPEISTDKKIVTNLNGNIEFNNVSFRYSDNMPMIIDDLTLKIKAGQYIAIVGKTGCGKSTLVRLLLGFEKPLKGSIYYDGKDINSLDLQSLRRKIGTVMQDGKLFQGNIYSNITISAPWLTINEAFEAADIAGIGDDIRNMPMGMHTLISEGSGGISGGQRQRILIARAVASKPKILIFDEATSALDNITQKHLIESLDKLSCTRIAIAHRLSTIKHCDRILYLEDGKIVEDGNYEELIKLNGKFAKLVERQRLDEKDGVQ